MESSPAPTPRHSAEVLSGWRQALATRMLGLQLLFGLPLIVWSVPQMVSSRAWALLANVALQVLVQAAMTFWTRGPLALRGGVTSLAFVSSGAGILLGGGDPASSVLFLMTAAVMAVVLLGVRGALLILAVDALVIVLHGWGNLPPVVAGRFLVAPERVAAVQLAVFLTLAAVVVSSAGFLVSRLRQSIDDVLVSNERLVQESAEKQKALEELRVMQERLVQAGKVEVLGQVAGGIAHDMNNALTVVLGEAGLLAEQHRAASEHIFEAVDHVAQLTRQLLAMGRREAVRPRPLDARAAVEKAVTFARRTLPEDITVEMELQEGAFIRADPSQVQQVILNLTNNARDAMPAGGRILISLAPTDDAVTLVVRDSGHGMDEATRLRVFEPFFTTKRSGKGTGLGLASVKDVVERMGGTVSCESRPGVGTSFSIVLPRLPRTEELGVAPSPASPVGALSGRRILLVEDDIRVRAAAVMALQRASAQVVDAGSAAQAIAWASQDPLPFDLVWTDVVMPDGGAAPLLAWLAQHRPALPVIVCTGYPDDELVRRDLALGRYMLLPKPFTAAQAVDACLDALRAPAAAVS